MIKVVEYLDKFNKVEFKFDRGAFKDQDGVLYLPFQQGTSAKGLWFRAMTSNNEVDKIYKRNCSKYIY